MNRANIRHLDHELVVQNQSVAEMTAAENCPSGIQSLLATSNLKIQQNVELIKTLLGYETSNIYNIINEEGEKIFHAVEILNFNRKCCSSIRSFELKIYDNSQREVIHLSRPLNCQSCFINCCMPKIEVYSPPGCLVGVVEQDWSILTPMFTIRNAVDEEVLKIKATVMFGFRRNVDFKILSKDKKSKIGYIRKQSSPILRDAFTDADFFDLKYPQDLDVHMKMVMIGASFLMNLMYFEH